MTVLPDLEPLLVPIDSIKPLPGNPRRGDVEAVKRALEKFGMHKPIVVQRPKRKNGKGICLAGNHTLRAAIELGWERIPVVWTDDDDATAEARSLADNRTGDLGTYDNDDLLAMLERISREGMLASTGYDEEFIARLRGLTPMALTEPDDAPPLPKKATSKVGDLWHLGEHRLVVGDSTDPTVIARVMGGEQAALVWTDPPYGVAYVGKTADSLTIENDDLDEGGLSSLLVAVCGNAAGSCAPGATWFVCAPGGPLFAIASAPLLDLGIWRQTLIWEKDVLVMGRSDYHYRYEPIIFGWMPDAGHHRPPDRKGDTIWQCDRPKRSKEHPTMKPVALIDRAIRNHTDPAEIVLDPFGGSGSTLIACHGADRKCRMVELDEKYADVILQRWALHTGEDPVLDDGTKWSEANGAS